MRGKANEKKQQARISKQKTRSCHTNVIKSRSCNHWITNWTLWRVAERLNWSVDENRAHPLNSNEKKKKKNKCTSFSMLIVWNDLFESISKRQRGVVVLSPLSCRYKTSLIMPSCGGNRSNHSIPALLANTWWMVVVEKYRKETFPVKYLISWSIFQFRSRIPWKDY